jgi:hypothetical protein
MANFQSANYAQQVQLDATGLLPRSFMTGVPEIPVNVGERDWYAFAPSRAGFQNYIMASGASRMRQNTRNPITAKRNGGRELLRSAPAVALTATQPWFNDSEWRTDLVAGIGCTPRF